ncbi:MAG: putative dehydrogenase [Psychroserpens sp.]|jgi:predicted dehydrogenase
MENKYRWGILGTGNAANVLAEAIKTSDTGILAGIASREEKSAANFAKAHSVKKYFSSYEKLLEDSEIDIVCIALPHSLHAEWSIKTAEAKKHILCEKPCAINFDSAVEVIKAAKKNDVFYMEGFMYRCHKQTKKLVELLQNKIIGDVRLIEASFCYHAFFDSKQIFLKKTTGGGAILDVGCYPMSMVRLIASTENKTDSISPLKVQAMAHVGVDSESDEWAIANIRFKGDILAQISTGVSVEHRNDLRIFGSKGSIYIPSPWVPGGSGPGITSIFLKQTGVKEIQELHIETKVGLYQQEIDIVGMNINNREAKEMSWQDTLDNMMAMQMWRKSVGIKPIPDSYIAK